MQTTRGRLIDVWWVQNQPRRLVWMFDTPRQYGARNFTSSHRIGQSTHRGAGLSWNATVTRVGHVHDP
ncbi:MAG: hypothetical protein M3N95_17205 [Actinomycetota bacterium]|nr:hypothetical protein [Actinomycetota bacterium]